jgi:CAAX prenyl protease-like protein
MEEGTKPLEYESPRPPRARLPLIDDDRAYLLPMVVFLGLTFVGGHWPGLFRVSYVLKTLAAGGLLIALRGYYTKINWKFAWLGVIVGILGLVQWVGMEKGILHFWPNYWRPSAEVVDPFKDRGNAIFFWIFIAVRLIGPALVVPFMEEYFWRDFLWRTIAAPNDFKMVPVGEWDLKAFVIVTLAFSSVHIQWITAIVWGLMIAVLLVRTKSLGACIIAHGVTNLLLGIYVLVTHDWQFW